jgi:hypothetical protein
MRESAEFTIQDLQKVSELIGKDAERKVAKSRWRDAVVYLDGDAWNLRLGDGTPFFAWPVSHAFALSIADAINAEVTR